MGRIAPERLRPLRRSEYDRLVAAGAFSGERIELLRGTLIEMSPQGTRHAEVVRRLTRILVSAPARRAIVQVQAPFVVSDESEPEPDLAVIPPGDYSRAHPDRAWLIIEVAESSLAKDRDVKAELYAEAGVPEYWLVDLVADAVEILTGLRQDRYTRLTTHTAGPLRPEAFPDLEIEAAELLP